MELSSCFLMEELASLFYGFSTCGLGFRGGLVLVVFCIGCQRDPVGFVF